MLVCDLADKVREAMDADRPRTRTQAAGLPGHLRDPVVTAVAPIPLVSPELLEPMARLRRRAEGVLVEVAPVLDALQDEFVAIDYAAERSLGPCPTTGASARTSMGMGGARLDLEACLPEAGPQADIPVVGKSRTAESPRP